MAQKRKTHLRIHNESVNEPTSPSNVIIMDEVANCLTKFTQATGWAIRSTATKQNVFVDGSLVAASGQSTRPDRANQFSQSTPRKRWEVLDAMPIDGMLDMDAAIDLPMVTEAAADALLGSIADLVARLERAENAVREQQASLATDVAVTRNKDEGKEIADRLESILASSCTSIKATAAAIYILDDQTSELKMRACWNLPVDRLLSPARPLRGSLADLEALMGNAVLLEDLAAVPSWSSPEQFASAIVVPIGTIAMPHGTIWYWTDHSRKYDSAQVEVANLACGRVMNELEQSVLGAEVQQSRTVTRQIDQASLAISSRSPLSMPLHENIELDGWSLQDDLLGGAIHNWEMNPQGQIVAMIGNARHSGPQGALVATALHSITRSQWAMNATPSQIMQLLSDYLMECGEDDWSASASLLQIDPLTGRGCVTNAGGNQILIASHRGFRPIGGTAHALATDPNACFANARFVLQPGETLLAMSENLVRQLNLPMTDLNLNTHSRQSQQIANAVRRHRRALAKSLDQNDLLREIRTMTDEPAEDIAQHFARRLPILLNREGVASDRALLVVRNQQKGF